MNYELKMLTLQANTTIDETNDIFDGLICDAPNGCHVCGNGTEQTIPGCS